MKHNFRELLIWKRSMNFVTDIYHLTPKLPDHEKYGLATQIHRAAVSIPSNIAEGSTRTTDKEFSRFLDFSLGSSYETETQIIITKNVYPERAYEVENLQTERRQIQKMIVAFQNGLNK